MEWYFSNDRDDLVVPKDMKPIDRLPSPNSWSDWGVSDFPKKNFDGENLCDELDLSISRHQMECSSNSSMSYGFQNNLQQWGTPSQRPSDIQMDEIYMNSLLDEDLATENLYGSSSFSPTSNSNGFGGSNYFENDTFSPTTDWNREASNSFPSGKEPVLKDSVASEHGTGREYMHEQTSVEESVLQELEMVTSKLNLKTRNCFRDSLYRLAVNSRTNTSTPVQNGDVILKKTPVETVNNDKFRVQETEATESKTNAIDRAIANLMFAKMDFYVEEEIQAHVVETQYVKSEADGRTEQFQYNSDEPWATCFPMLVGDAEVPVIATQSLYTRGQFKASCITRSFQTAWSTANNPDNSFGSRARIFQMFLTLPDDPYFVYNCTRGLEKPPHETLKQEQLEDIRCQMFLIIFQELVFCLMLLCRDWLHQLVLLFMDYMTMQPMTTDGNLATGVSALE
ncbi:hypothetical protein POM88_000577 [Heracleum sosnowskyi]|uniref:Uncharacterized protein n=1 Tax=Heracleum sosnowskyi TaxID=360622 RepID=A0AAD8JAZ9_9APIA|nr:hypothetical protein POM88_000577 [Heracleum sosnowskyi]